MILRVIKFLFKNGFKATSKAIVRESGYKLQGFKKLILDKYFQIKYKNKSIYENPTDEELVLIEKDLKELGIPIYDYIVDLDKLQKFKSQYSFPGDYHGGVDSTVYEEKILEHFVSFDLLDLSNFNKDQSYIDVASGGSPWSKILRENNIKSFSLDLSDPYEEFKELEFYKKMDATKTDFDDNSIDGISLQCAFEMFAGNSDIELIKESSRILKENGKLIINPLYMHTHNCHYSSPDFYSKGYGDKDSKEYIRWGLIGIYTSRKYSATKLKDRILNIIKENNMNYKIHILRNKKNISPNIYLHFILEVTKC